MPLLLKTLSLVAALCLLTACSGKPAVVEPKPSASTERVATVFVVSHGWHTGVAIEREAIAQRLPALAQRFSHAPFIEIGWGDKGFYQSEQVTVGLALRAMFWSPGSVIHAVAVPALPACYFAESQVIALPLTAEQLDSLTEFISGSFARDAQSAIIPSKHGIYGDSQFYDGEGHYHLLNTCNKWTAKALKSAGVDIAPALKLTAGSVMSLLEQQPNALIYSADRAFCAAQ